jgi:hypothetical protein
MYKRNPLMLAKGFAPAAEVGRALNKSLSTIHRLVNEEHVNGARDGKALYVDLESLAAHFDGEQNPILAEAARKLRRAVIDEVGGPVSAAPTAGAK